MKRIIIGILAFMLLGNVGLQAATIEEINAKVDRINKQIKDKDISLPSIETRYDYIDPTESVPPEFSFFFDIDTGKLVACRVHVGHETWAKQFFYYFDENEKIMKYLEIIPPGYGSGPEPYRAAIIYNAKGKVLWDNYQAPPRHTPEAIKALYRTLHDAALRFAAY
ncbi:MAG: hypothetical protein FWG81_05305 [Betaproteobacteria bacterium]|nr:hypothetical protein [Betaproteobacteria bacterium]